MRALVLLAALTLLTACSTRSVVSDSKSNWLRVCTASSECGADLDCACGICSKVCASSAACTGAGNVAVCVDPIEQDLPASCQSKPSASAPGICLQSCLDTSQCGEHQRCTRGVCVAAATLDGSAGKQGSNSDGNSDGMDAMVDDATVDSGAIDDAAVLDSSSPAASDAGRLGEPLDAGVQTGQPPLIEVDCRPGYDIVGEFDSRCQYVGGDLPIISCPALGPSPTGSIVLTVQHAERIRIGQPVVLDGDDPDVTLQAAVVNMQALVQSFEGGGVSGTLIFDELQVGQILRGRIVDLKFKAQPDPPFDCQIKDATFVADWGPGVNAK